MTQEDIIKELEAMRVDYLKRSKLYSAQKVKARSDYYIGLAYEGSKITTYILSDISQLLTKIKQQ